MRFSRFAQTFNALLLLSLASGLFLSFGSLRAEEKNPSATLKGDHARPEKAQWLRTELYFATGVLGDKTPRTSDAAWLAFLDKEVTPRFPDGLTVFDAYGQWRKRGVDTPSRLVSKVIVILHEDDAASRTAIDEIRLAWKNATGDQSVLLVNEKVEVSF